MLQSGSIFLLSPFCEPIVFLAAPCAHCHRTGPVSGQCQSESLLGPLIAVRQCGTAHTAAHQLRAVPSVLCEWDAACHHIPASALGALLRGLCGASQRGDPDAGVCGPATEPAVC